MFLHAKFVFLDIAYKYILLISKIATLRLFERENFYSDCNQNLEKTKKNQRKTNKNKKKTNEKLNSALI
jgi:hypothetical protein